MKYPDLLSHIGSREAILIGVASPVEGGFLHRCLTNSGYRAIVCETYSALEDALAKAIPDQIILDYNFDGLPGMEAGVRILAQEPYSNIPLLILFFKSRHLEISYPKELANKRVSVFATPYGCEEIPSYLSRLFARRREAEGLEARATEMIRDTPDDPDGYVLLGKSCSMTGDTSGAMAAYKMAVEKDPDCAEAYSSLGNIYWTIGNYAEAVQARSQLVRLRPTDADCLRVLGTALVRTGAFEKAREVWTRALEYADPDRYQSLLARLESIKVPKP